MVIMWVKQCHKPPIWEWFIPPIHGEIGDGLWHCFTNITGKLYIVGLYGINVDGKSGYFEKAFPPFILNTHVHEWTQIWFLLLLNHGFWGVFHILLSMRDESSCENQSNIIWFPLSLFVDIDVYIVCIKLVYTRSGTPQIQGW